MWNLIRNTLNKRKWARWNNTPKDLVILHTFGKAETIPSASPFVLKVQTYLRMAKIPHKTDSKDMLGPKGKAPWISLNGEHIADSELIIRHLNKHFNVNLNKGPYTPAQLATATCARVTLEEHFLWGFALERFLYNPSQWKKVVTVGPMYDTFFIISAGQVVRKRADAQGIGLHSQEDVEALCSKDLRAVSTLLGNNKYFLGEVPCQDDCSFFAMIAECMWGLPNSPYQKLVNDELTNLKEYCLRMKEEYYPDWDKCIRRPQSGQSSSQNENPKIKSKL